MKCPHCGKEIADGSKFCEFCGKQVKQAQKNTNLVAIIIALVVLLLGACGGILFLTLGNRPVAEQAPQEPTTDTISTVVTPEVETPAEEPEVTQPVVEEPVTVFPERDRVIDMLQRFVNYTVNDNINGMYEIYAPTLGRFHDIKKQVSREDVIDTYRRYNSKFGVYGKSASYRWETLSIHRVSNTRAEVVCVQDYHIDRYDESKYTDFVLEQHFVINENYQIVSIYDVQLSKR
ncbi:MAG: zinc-ribbon domain-containing protein [Paludibacteraceae bacterium]|nr:zinc-ribbon domain-containing protein [Paludibacteraceae bacterium]